MLARGEQEVLPEEEEEEEEEVTDREPMSPKPERVFKDVVPLMIRRLTSYILGEKPCTIP